MGFRTKRPAPTKAPTRCYPSTFVHVARQTPNALLVRVRPHLAVTISQQVAHISSCLQRSARYADPQGGAAEAVAVGVVRGGL